MADERITRRRIELRVKIYRAKLNYLAIGFLTLVNVVLALFNTTIEMPFYLSLPYVTFLIGRNMIGHPEYFGEMILWFVLAAALAAVCIWMYIRSRKGDRIGGLLAVVVVDMIGNVGMILIGLVLSFGGSWVFTEFLNLAFHVFVLVMLEGGRRAAYGLTLLPDEEDGEESDPDDTPAGINQNGDE